MREIPLARSGRVALVDDEDFDTQARIVNLGRYDTVAAASAAYDAYVASISDGPRATSAERE